MTDPDDTTHPAPGTDSLALPEFTRSLRGFASVAALRHPDHDRVFGPLIAARRSAARVRAPDARAAAFDADRLRRALRDAIATMAHERSGGDPAVTRAYEARLEHRAGRAFAALDTLARAAASLRAATTGELPARWADWCAAVQGVFNAVDNFWLERDAAAPPTGRSGRLLLALLTAAALAATADPAAAQHVTLRVEGARPDSLLAAGFDVVGMDRGATLVVAAPPDRARLEAAGLRVADMPRPFAAQRVPAAAQTPAVYRSFDDPARGVRAWVDSLARANPRVSVDTIGRSYQGRPLLVLKIGPRGDGPQRPNTFFVATYHAREWAATEMALRLVRWLAEPPGTDARRDSLVQARDIYVLPVANPDGYEYTFSTDRLWRKTRSPQAGGATGVDMNRNHTVNWGLDNQGSSPDPRSEIYRGPQAASEAEVRHVEAFLAIHPPTVAISYHSYAGLILHPPGVTYGALPADAPVYRALSGTNIASAITDRLPGSIRAQYAPGPAWLLYTTNGEFADFVSMRHRTLAWTVELTSGYGPGGYYGFEFPDDETQLDRLFRDNLPFALDLLDAAADPAAVRSATTGLRPDRVVLEAVSPDIRVTLPATESATATIVAAGAVPFRVDSTNGGRYVRRLVSQPVSRPAALSITTASGVARFRVLAVGGAEAADPAWTSQGFVRDSLFARAGTFSWFGTTGVLTTAPVALPQDSDTASVMYWAMHSGNGFTPEPSGRVDASLDGGLSWTPLAVHRGFAPVWYTAYATIGGVRGKTLRLRFTANGMPWRLDEVAVVSHGQFVATGAVAGAHLRPSENPVRSGLVRFTWPFGATDGELAAFDVTGRKVWRAAVRGGAPVTWDLAAQGVANGVYVVVARSGSRTSRLKLFVARVRP